ncbi:hypothetical protein C9374_009328 [Naegleria lovaniensis]|uniref:Uncharacterized protein n=1 Tax=Naegleria lovaniensis TaxID=51637 RepID=A0AA88GHD6_NAELO|nr:uncharacterized protein C9374_009328 [Naegleria lovaniensis]KAG2377417.1 hypothetical protein C9374_009328 [Naegleria lovaniensis]
MKLFILSLSSQKKSSRKQHEYLSSLIGTTSTVSRGGNHSKLPITEINLNDEVQQVEIDELNEVEDLVGSPSLIYVLDRYTRQVFELSSNESDRANVDDLSTSHIKWKVEKLQFGTEDTTAHLRVLKISTYTEHALFLLEDMRTRETFLYGRGSNAYSRLSNDENIDLDQPVFSPHLQLHNNQSRVTHVGCCFSFSVCIVNDTDVHMTGQNWIDNSTGYHNWVNRAHVCPKPVKSLHCGNFHFIILLVDGSMCVAGSYSSGQLIMTNITPFQQIPTSWSFHAGVYAKLGTNCSLLTSMSNTYHFFGGPPFKVEGDDRRVKSPLVMDHHDSKEFPYDEAFLGREYGAFHFKKNHLLYILGNANGISYNHIIRYSSLFSTQPHICTLPMHIVFYLNPTQSAFHKKLLEKVYLESQHTISDMLIATQH